MNLVSIEYVIFVFISDAPTGSARNMNIPYIAKVGWSANKLRKLQIRKFADINNRLDCGLSAS